MAMTAAQRRKADRERKRNQRAAAAEIGQPARVETINAAVVEALAFALFTADTRAWDRKGGWTPINVTVVIAAAADILTTRYGNEPVAAKKAVVDRLRPRGRHKMPTSVPSANPDPGLPRYNTRAPDAALRLH